MTSAVDTLITAALQSDDTNIRALAEAAQVERNRKRGRPGKLSANDADAMFIIFDGIFARHYTGEVNFVDGEPVAVTDPTIDTTEAIAHELASHAGCSINTARKFAREQIAAKAAAMKAQAAGNGVQLNMPDSTPQMQIKELKWLTNNS